MPLKINNFSSSLGTKWFRWSRTLPQFRRNQPKAYTPANGQLVVTGTPALRLSLKRLNIKHIPSNAEYRSLAI